MHAGWSGHKARERERILARCNEILVSCHQFASRFRKMGVNSCASNSTTACAVSRGAMKLGDTPMPIITSHHKWPERSFPSARLA